MSSNIFEAKGCHIELSLDMFDPESSGSNTPSRTLRFVRQFWGDPGIELFRQARDLGRKNGINEPLRRRAEKQFFRNIRHIYMLPRGVNPHHFYEQQQASATSAITDLIDRFPGLQDTLDLSEEARVWTERSTDPLKMLAWSDQDINPRARYEIMRRMFIAHALGLVNSRVASDFPRSTLLDAQLLLDDQVFEGRVADSDPYKVHSYHDPVTNTFRGLDRNGRVPLGSIERKHPFSVRTVGDGIGSVYTHGRLKDEGSLIIKLLAKAGRPEKKGIVSPDDVVDNTGILYVVMDETKLHPFIGRVLDVIRSHPKGVEKIIGDNETEGDRGQSNRLNNQRWQVYFKDTIAPLELIFYKPGDYLNQVYEVGKKERATGYYKGNAHELYELRRLSYVFTLLFPDRFYGDEPREAVRDAMEQKAGELRNRNRVN